MGDGWANLGKALAVVTLIVTPFIAVVPTPLVPYLTAAVTGLNAVNVYIAHANNPTSTRNP